MSVQVPAAFLQPSDLRTIVRGRLSHGSPWGWRVDVGCDEVEFQRFDCLVEHGCQETAENGADPIYPVVTGKPSGDDCRLIHAEC